MLGKSPVTGALKALAGGADRAEADRALAILLTLAGLRQRPSFWGSRGYDTGLRQRFRRRGRGSQGGVAPGPELFARQGGRSRRSPHGFPKVSSKA